MNKSIKPFATFLVSFLLASFIILQSCNKKTDPTPTPTPTPTPANYICTGNGAATYMPLKLGNKWEYTSKGFFPHSEEVTGSVTYSGKSYFEVTYLSQVDNLKRYYRMDTNGDIYKYNTSDSKEYLQIPANPTLAQTVITNSAGDYFMVSNLSATYKSYACSYTGLIKIDLYFKSGTQWDTYYYKKGLGWVGESSGFGHDDLDVVTLK